MSGKAWYSKTWNFWNGEWIEGNPGLIGPRSHASWLASSVFDGARIFEGVAPDLELHCERLNRSAVALGLKPVMKSEEIAALALEGEKKFGENPQLYVKPMYWGEEEGVGMIPPNPESTRFCLCLFEMPLAPADASLTLTKTVYHRPTFDVMPTNAKAGCLYPNGARIIREATAKGFSNALVCDALGNIAETASSNIFLVKDGIYKTPVVNGSFLNGITRQRVISLLKDAGEKVEEVTLTYDDFLNADEVFTSGNYAKVMKVSKIDDVVFKTDQAFRKARELYWNFAHGK